jgi:hypothetical protein
MNTTIDHPRIFYTVYRKQSSPSSPSPLPYFKVVGAYADVRDAIQAIASAYRRGGGDYSIESSPNRPKHWIHPSKYRD